MNIDQKDAKCREGDTCVIHISENMRYLFRIYPDQELQTKFGLLKATQLINHPYGQQFQCKKGWILPLKLTPELWTQLVPHRTQILYQADISLILLYLDIKPGSIVVESGTGSGSLSHSILRACSPNGFLHTFEINESRSLEAKKEFGEHGYFNVQVHNQDVCESQGFGDDLIGKVDACILDLPRTWEAIEKAYKVMKDHGSRLCTFSPCIEQVQRNVAKMNELKLRDIVTYECLMRPLDVKISSLRSWDDDILDKLIEVDNKKLELVKMNFDPLKKPRRDSSETQHKAVFSEFDNMSRSSQPTDEKSNSDSINNYCDQLTMDISNPKVQFNCNMLPKWTRCSATKQRDNVTHSGFLTFACKGY